MLKAAVGDLRRLRRIVSVLTRHGFDELAGRLWRRAAPAGEAPGDPPGDDSPEPRARTGGDGGDRRPAPAVRFRRVLEDLGPTFIKLGQVLSTRPDLLPRAYVAELEALQDRVAPVPAADVRETIAEALGRPVPELFRRFDDEPLATASIAQTHRAWLADGACVAVKVRRPGIAETIRSDLDLLRVLAHLIEATVEEARIYDPVGIVREFEAAILDELDFDLELRHMQAFHANFLESDVLVVPAPYPTLSARTVLTMEFLDGVKLSSLALSAEDAGGDGLAEAPRHDRRALAEAVVEAWYRQVFIDGLFHADPHPGNLLVLPGDRLALLDYGLVGRVPPAIQDTLALLAIGISMKDVAGLARLIYRVGAPEERVSISGFRREIQDLLDRYLGLEIAEIDTRSLLSELLDLSLRHRIRVQPEYALLAKAGGTIEGVLRDLDPGLNLYEVGRPFVRDLMGRRLDPERLGGEILRGAMGLASFVQEVPGQIDQVLQDLGGGQLTIRVEHDALTQLGRHINHLATRVMLGLFGGACVIASAVLAAPWLERQPSPWPAVLTLLAAAGVVVVMWAWHFAVAAGGRKLRLRDVAAFWRRMRGPEDGPGRNPGAPAA